MYSQFKMHGQKNIKLFFIVTEIGFGLLSAEASKCSYRSQVHLGDMCCSFPFRQCRNGPSPVRDFGFRIQL